MRVGSTRNVAVSFNSMLETTEVLLITDLAVTSAGLTIANLAINSAAIDIEGTTVAIGKAVKFSVADATADTQYTIAISVGTDATPAQVLVEDVFLQVD